MTWPTFSSICQNYCVLVCALWAVMRGWSRVDQRAKPVAYGHVLGCCGMRDSKLNKQELVHMVVWILTCQHCICNSSSRVPNTYFSLSLPPPPHLPTNYYQRQHHNHLSVESVGKVEDAEGVLWHQVGPQQNKCSFNFTIFLSGGCSCWHRCWYYCQTSMWTTLLVCLPQ